MTLSMTIARKGIRLLLLGYACFEVSQGHSKEIPISPQAASDATQLGEEPPFLEGGRFFLRVSYFNGGWSYAEHFIAGEIGSSSGAIPIAFHQFKRFGENTTELLVVRRQVAPASDWDFLRKWMRQPEVYRAGAKFYRHDESVAATGRDDLEIEIRCEDTNIRYMLRRITSGKSVRIGEKAMYDQDTVGLLKQIQSLFKEFGVRFDSLSFEFLNDIAISPE